MPLKVIKNEKENTVKVHINYKYKGDYVSWEAPLPNYPTDRFNRRSEAIRKLEFKDATESEITGRLLAEERKIIGEIIYDVFGEKI